MILRVDRVIDNKKWRIFFVVNELEGRNRFYLIFITSFKC